MSRFAWMPAATAAAAALVALPSLAAADGPRAPKPFPCPAMVAPGYCGDGGSATRAGLSLPVDVASLPNGAYVVADTGNDAVRAVDPDGLITTLAGGDLAGRNGAALLRLPAGVAVDANGGILVADTGNNRVLALGPRGTARRIAGDGVPGHRGDGGRATLARLSQPAAVATAPDGGVLIADTGNNRVRLVQRSGRITTLAGTGNGGFGGDGGPAVLARIERPVDVVILRDGTVVVASADGRLRQITPEGTITSLPVRLRGAPAIAGLDDGTLLVADPSAGHVMRLAPGSFAAQTIATTECVGAPDASFAAVRGLRYPSGLAPTATGAILVADPATDRVVRIAAGLGAVVAGGGLLAPRRSCASLGSRPDPAEILARLRAGPIGTDSGYPSGPPPPLCSQRPYWTFQLRYRFTSPRVPRVRRPFAMHYSTDRRVLVRLTVERAGRTRRFPGHAILTAHAQFRIRLAHGLPRRGRYHTRLVATAGRKRQCIDKRIRIRSRR